MTATTTIKVSSQVRDQLKAQAGAAGVTLGQYLAALARRAGWPGLIELVQVGVRRPPHVPSIPR